MFGTHNSRLEDIMWAVEDITIWGLQRLPDFAPEKGPTEKNIFGSLCHKLSETPNENKLSPTLPLATFTSPLFTKN